MMNTTTILFVTSEAQPLIKTGGLADVAGSLPAALSRLGHDIRVLIPAYRDALKTLAHIQIVHAQLPGLGVGARLLESPAPDSGVRLWLLDIPEYFDRVGNPYLAANGKDWPDNAERYTALCRTAASIAMNELGLNWMPQVVHCNDWQTALTPALLAGRDGRPASVFTIHNLAYQGLFDFSTFRRLRMPASLWAPQALEFYGQMSFIKGGLAYADMLTTVSPSYAREICSPEYGNGLDGLLRARGERLVGILNGIDTDAWNPATDSHIAHRYDAGTLEHKPLNRSALLAQFNLPATDLPCIGMIGRLVDQKGIELVLQCLDTLLTMPLTLIIIGNGEPRHEEALIQAQARWRDRLGVYIGFNEALAHQVESGADIFLMPSRYEPCGLNQMYSLRYGTLPIVRRTGGLADTVIDASEENLNNNSATGFCFTDAQPRALLQTVQRACHLFHDKPTWHAMMRRAMAQDFSWSRSAQRYLEVYRHAQQWRGRN